MFKEIELKSYQASVSGNYPESGIYIVTMSDTKTKVIMLVVQEWNYTVLLSDFKNQNDVNILHRVIYGHGKSDPPARSSVSEKPTRVEFTVDDILRLVAVSQAPELIEKLVRAK